MSQNSRSRRDKLLEAADGYLDLGMPEHALRSLREIDDPDRNLFAVNSLRGRALRDLKRFDEALEAYGRAFAENPDDVDLLMGTHRSAGIYPRWNAHRFPLTPDATITVIVQRQPMMTTSRSFFVSIETSNGLTSRET